MKKYLCPLFALILLAGTFSCQVKIDEEADKQTVINMTSEEWDKNELAGLYEANLESLTDDAVFIAGGEIYSGKESIRNLFTKRAKNNISIVDNEVVDIWKSGDLATVRGTFSVSYIQSEPSDTINFMGAFLSVCERQADGAWKIVHSLNTILNN